ncbi:MAG: acyl-CoA dehydrogenase [Actinobacteria bacterium]|nr:acyl-CoA dehydrogenase [Actinomycetota bacterium]
MAPEDLLEISSLLSLEEAAIRDSVRRYAERELAPGIAEHFEAGTFPKEISRSLGDLGLLGMHLEGYGCAGLNAVSYGLACLELEAIDSGFRSFVSVQGSLAMFPIWKYGSEDQKEEWLPKMAAGEAIGCFGLTETDAGSDPSGMRTTAKRSGPDWVLNGSKMWITNGGIADVAIVWAKTEDGLKGFIVPTDTPGFSTTDVAKKLSLRASVTSELIMDDCRIPESLRLPDAKGLRAPLSCLNEARFGIIWGVMGAARSCFTTALDYTGSRRQFDKPIASFQLTQERLVQIAVELHKGTLLALHLGRVKDESGLPPAMVSFGKLNNVAEALKIARSARGLLGANGITLEYPILRHMNNLESVYTYEGTNEIHTLIVGEALTGIPAYR